MKDRRPPQWRPPEAELGTAAAENRLVENRLVENRIAGDRLVEDLLATLTLDSGPGPARRLSSRRAHELIENVTRALDFGGADAGFDTGGEPVPPPIGVIANPSPRLAPQRASAARSRLAPRIGWLSAAAVLLFALGGGIATAHFIAVTRVAPPEVEPLPSLVAARRPHRPRPAVVELAPATPSSPEPLAEVPPELPPTQPSPAATHRSAESAALYPMLLARASDARTRGRWAEAESLYVRAARTAHPASAGYAAWIAAAELALEHRNDAAAARAIFRQQLAAHPQGMLAEEARLGLARAERRLGHTEAERQALRDFLSHHPSSLAAEGIRERLRALASGAR